MVEAMRRDICLADPTAAMVLHETRLAERFGVSRTPVRQALQRLAYERLVETRSGVGTTVTLLEPASVCAHVALLRGLLHLAVALGPLSCPAQPVIPSTLPEQREATPEAVFQDRAAILRMAGALIADPILQESHAAAHWRVVRWHVAAAQAEPVAAFAAAQRLRRAVAAAGEERAVLSIIAADPAPALPSPAV